jgi:hypothetical protein
MKKSHEVIVIVLFVVFLGFLLFVSNAIQKAYGPILASIILGVVALIIYFVSRELNGKTVKFIGSLMFVFAICGNIIGVEEKFNVVSAIGAFVFGGTGLLSIITSGNKEEKLKRETRYRNALMLFPKTVENITGIITKYYPVKTPSALKFETAVFVLYALDESYLARRPKWFSEGIITYISKNIKHFTKEYYDQKWTLYNEHSVNLAKHEYDYYKKFDTFFSLIKDNIEDEVEPKLFTNKNNLNRKAYLPIDRISEEIWKLEHVMD